MAVGILILKRLVNSAGVTLCCLLGQSKKPKLRILTIQSPLLVDGVGWGPAPHSVLPTTHSSILSLSIWEKKHFGKFRRCLWPILS